MKNILLLSGLALLLSGCYNQKADVNGFDFEGTWCVQEITKISTNEPPLVAIFIALSKSTMEFHIDEESIRMVGRDSLGQREQVEDEDIALYKKKHFSEETFYLELETKDKQKVPGEISASEDGIILKIKEMDMAYDLVKCR